MSAFFQKPRKPNKKRLQSAAAVTPAAAAALETETAASADSVEPATNHLIHDKEHRTPSSSSSSSAATASLNKKCKQPPDLSSSHELDPCLDPSAALPNLGVESETGQGLRCSIEKCGKLFRNDRLLQQHVKHYHPEVFDQVIASVTTPVTTGKNKTGKDHKPVLGRCGNSFKI